MPVGDLRRIDASLQRVRTGHDEITETAVTSKQHAVNPATAGPGVYCRLGLASGSSTFSKATYSPGSMHRKMGESLKSRAIRCANGGPGQAKPFELAM